MKTSKMYFLRLLGILISSLIILSFPVSALAAEQIEAVHIPASATATIPDASEISENPNYSEGTTMSAFSANQSVKGGCKITKLSSSKVEISGYSVTSPAASGLEVSLQLQAYYNKEWHTLKTAGKSVTGTRVNLSKTYNVTSGYYYRVIATHSLANGASTTSKTRSIWIG